MIHIHMHIYQKLGYKKKLLNIQQSESDKKKKKKGKESGKKNGKVEKKKKINSKDKVNNNQSQWSPLKEQNDNNKLFKKLQNWYIKSFGVFDKSFDGH